MSKGKAKPVKTRRERVDFVAYVRYVLTREWRESVNANLCGYEEALLWLEKQVEADYKVTIAWDYESECYSIGLFDNDPNRSTRGYILSSRHNDLCKCVSVLRFLHEVAFESGWPMTTAAREEISW